MKKHYSIIGVVLVVLMMTIPAMALNEAACYNPNQWWNPEGQTCIGLLTPEDMGTFDNETGAWVWNETFASELVSWMAIEIPNWRDNWAPSKDVIPSYTRLDVRSRIGQAKDTRFIYKGGLAVRSPMLWRVEGPNGEQDGSFFGFFKGDGMWLPPVGCVVDQDGNPEMWAHDCSNAYHELAEPVIVQPGEDPWIVGAYWQDENGNWFGWNPNPGSQTADDIEAADYINPCCKAWTPPPPAELEFYTIPLKPVTAADIESVTWNGITITSGFEDYYVDYQYLTYEMGPNMWKDTGWGEYSNESEVYVPSFGPGIVAPLGINIVNVILKNGASFDLEFDVLTNEDMPVVPAKSYFTDLVADEKKKKKKKKKSGKKIKATETMVEVDNITARELDGALVIQWTEPDAALTRPGMKLKMYVGDQWGREHVDQQRDTFLFIDCPVQTGTVVILAEIWEPFKQKMLSMNRTFVYVSGMYRFQSQYTMQPSQWTTNFHNRGYFEFIEFPLTP